jgi:hypothetical protein
MKQVGSDRPPLTGHIPRNVTVDFRMDDAERPVGQVGFREVHILKL